MDSAVDDGAARAPELRRAAPARPRGPPAPRRRRRGSRASPSTAPFARSSAALALGAWAYTLTIGTVGFAWMLSRYWLVESQQVARPLLLAFGGTRAREVRRQRRRCADLFGRVGAPRDVVAHGLARHQVAEQHGAGGERVEVAAAVADVEHHRPRRVDEHARRRRAHLERARRRAWAAQADLVADRDRDDSATSRLSARPTRRRASSRRWLPSCMARPINERAPAPLPRKGWGARALIRCMRARRSSSPFSRAGAFRPAPPVHALADAFAWRSRDSGRRPLTP